MKKVGIVTAYKIINYGSVLQAYATQKMIENLGYEANLINYEIKHDVHWIVTILRNLTSLYHWKSRFISISEKNKNVKSSNCFIERDKLFEKFLLDNIKESKKFIGWKELKASSNQFEIFVAGSDQIWHPCNRPVHYFTLDFVKDKKRISYASSFGVSSLPSYMKRGYKKELGKFHAISVREERGIDIINDLGLKASLVADPTLLLRRDEWERVKSNKFNFDNYIFCYFLGSKEEGRRTALKIKEKTGYKIIAIGYVDDAIEIDKTYADKQIIEAGPSEFLELISKAKYVLTDSFHCCVFSIINNKEFIVFKRFDEGNLKSTNSRIYNLLNLFNLEDHMYSENIKIEDILEKTINYTEVEKILNKFRKESIDFLKNALGDKNI